MSRRRDLRRNGDGNAQLEAIVIGAIAVTMGLTLSAVYTRAAGRFHEVDAAPLTWTAAASTPRALESPRPSTVARGLLARLAWRALALATLAPIDWERFGIDADDLAEQAHYRAPIVAAVSTTAANIVPAASAMISAVIDDPMGAVAAFANPVELVVGSLSASYENVKDWMTLAFAESDEASSQAGARITSGIVTSIMLGSVMRGRGGPRRAVKVLNLENPVQRRAWERFLASPVRRGQIRGVDFDVLPQGVAYALWKGKNITAAMRLVDEIDALEVELIGRFSPTDGRTLLQHAIGRSIRNEPLAHQGRLRATPPSESRSFFLRNGFVPMFEEFPTRSDLVLSASSAGALLRGRTHFVYGQLEEWTRLASWQSEHMRALAPELFADVRRFLASKNPADPDFSMQLLPGHTGPLMNFDTRTLVFDANMRPTDRLQALAYEIGERRFGVAGPRADEMLLEPFLQRSLAARAETMGAGIINELRARARMMETAGRQIPSRYPPGILAIYERLKNSGHEARLTLGHTWSAMSGSGRGPYAAAIWKEELTAEWLNMLRGQQQSAVREAERIVREHRDRPQ